MLPFLFKDNDMKIYFEQPKSFDEQMTDGKCLEDGIAGSKKLNTGNKTYCTNYVDREEKDGYTSIKRR